MTAPGAPTDPIHEPITGTAFHRAVAAVEHHRNRVRGAIALALVARLFGEFNLMTLVRNAPALIDALPSMGLALLSYLIVLWFLAARTRDRFGFGMALGIGVLEATYLLVTTFVTGRFVFADDWPALVVAVAHLPLAVVAFRSSSAYPAHDTKRPWIVGFVAALVFVAVPWVAPSVMEFVKRVRG